MIDEVKIDFKGAALIRNGRRGQPTLRDIERHMPPVVHMWTQLHSDLPNDLRPHVKGIQRLLPCFIRQQWPTFYRFSCACNLFCVHISLLLVLDNIYCSYPTLLAIAMLLLFYYLPPPSLSKNQYTVGSQRCHASEVALYRQRTRAAGTPFVV